MAQLGAALAGRSEQQHAVDFGLDLETHSRILGLLVDRVAKRGASRREHDGVLGQRLKVDLVERGQRMIGGRQDDAVFVEEHLGVDIRVVDGQIDDRAVEATARDLGQERCRGGVDHDELNPGVAGAELAQQCRNQPAGGRADDPHTHDTSHLTRVGGQVGVDGLELGLYAPGSFDHRLAFDGQLARAAFDEDDAELTLEPRNVGGDVGLHRVQRARGGREAGVVRDGDQGSELPEIHRWQ